MTIDRRSALSLLALTTAAPLSAAAKPVAAVAVAFRHGVASGDPLQHRVILWTRVTPEAAGSPVAVKWEIAEDAAFAHIAAQGAATTDGGRDYTVKIDAGGLRPGQEYFYRFRAGKIVSPIGRTKTLPQGATDKIVLAFVTCSLYPAGYFNAYDHLAKLDRVDAVVELGDYYYEYGGPGSYGYEAGKAIGRVVEPQHNIVTLADYRMRHAQYKSDPDLQAAHARAPWICVWDDHETANDSWNGGAEHHDPKTEGPWIEREQAAMRAYYEWMPIREPEPGRAFEAINRSFQFGDLASLIMVETRLVGRTKQLSYARPEEIPMAVYSTEDPARKPVTDPKTVAAVMAAVKAGKEPNAPHFMAPDVPALLAILNSPDRQMLGARQEEWVKLEIARSVSAGRPWQILGNQVVMGRCNAPDIVKAIGVDKAKALIAAAPDATRPRLKRYLDYFGLVMPYDLDGWDGYPAARERLFDAIKASNANTIVVSGDSHSFWVNELFDAAGATRVAAEFGAGSVTSPSLGEAFRAVDMGKLFADQNKEVLLNEQLRHGYVRLTVTKEHVTGELISTEIAKKPYAAEVFSTWRVSPAEGAGVGEIAKV